MWFPLLLVLNWWIEKRGRLCSRRNQWWYPSYGTCNNIVLSGLGREFERVKVKDRELLKVHPLEVLALDLEERIERK